MEASKPLSAILSDPDTYTGDCQQHGAFIGRFIQGPTQRLQTGCPTCSAERKAKFAEQERRDEKERQELANKRLTEERRKAGIPARFEDKTFATYVADSEGRRKALEAMQGLVAAIKEGRQAPNLILTGNPGTGKSHLSCAAIRALYRSHYVLRIDLPDMIRRIRDTWRKDSEKSEQEVIEWLGGLDLLILEEVGTGAGSDDERARIFSVMNARYENCLPTVLVTNLAMERVKEEMGERVIDRLREGERSLVVFDWESARGAA